MWCLLYNGLIELQRLVDRHKKEEKKCKQNIEIEITLDEWMHQSQFDSRVVAWLPPH